MTTFENRVLGKVRAYLKKEFPSDPTSHDYWHFDRVAKSARKIAKSENAKVNMFVVELGALLHDVGDWKFNSDGSAGGKNTRLILSKINVPKNLIKQVMHIVDNVSFKGAKVKNKMQSLEGKIVQDADHLDAIGAVGISRVFATGSFLGHLIHDPSIKPILHKSFKDYKKSSTSINHFYEKLLLLKDMMNTRTGKLMAKERHKFVEKFLKKFLREWSLGETIF